jgi:hypothetical protein
MIITYKSIFSKLRDIVKVFMRCTYINKHNKYISINSLVVKILSVWIWTAKGLVAFLCYRLKNSNKQDPGKLLFVILELYDIDADADFEQF